jgi:hypothetical protein
MTGVIYIAEQVGGRLVKIGWTKGCPKRRVQSLQTGSPKRLRLVGTIPAESVEDEKRLHTQFADLRVKGEWFKRSKAILSLLPKPPKPERQSVSSYPKAKLPSEFRYLRDRYRYCLLIGFCTREQVQLSAALTSQELDWALDDEEAPADHEVFEWALHAGLNLLDAPFPARRSTDRRMIKRVCVKYGAPVKQESAA